MAIAAVAAGAMRIGSMFARGAGKGGGMLRKAILKRTKVRRENIARNKQLNKKLMEKQRRREKASLLKAFKTRGKSGISGVEVPGKSFLDRVLEFFGVLLIGWLVDKLPQIIAWVEDLIKRIRLLVSSLKSFINNLGNWFRSIGSVISSTLDNWRNFDFTDQSGKVKKAMTDMENAFKGMQSDLGRAKTAVTGDMKEVGAASGGADASAGAASIDDPNARALLNAIAEAEGTSRYPNQGYNTQFTGTQFTDLSKHPEQLRSGGGYTSDAAGRYQFLSTTWNSVMGGAMTPERQDMAALKLVARRGVDIKNGLSMNEIYKLGGEWASIEGGPNMRKGGSYGGQAKYSAESFLQMYQKYGGKVEGGSGAGDGRIARGKNQTPAYQRAVNVGRALEAQGYRAWQHPDFNVHSGYTGSGRERVMRRSYNSYHNYGEALDYPLSHNSEAQLDKLASYFRQNKAALGVAEVIWRSAGHYDHLHVSFKGGGSVDRMPIAGNVDMGAGVGQPQNTIIIIEEEAPPMAGGGGKGGSPPIIMGASLNSIIKKHLLTSLAYN